MFVVLYASYLIIMIFTAIGFWCVGYDEGCKDTEKMYKSDSLKGIH